MRQSFDRRRFLERFGLLAGGAIGGYLLAPTMHEHRQALAENQQPMHNAEEQLKRLNLQLPAVARPTGATLVPTVRVGDMLYVSGHGPSPVDGRPVVGKLGQNLDVQQGQAAARNVGLRILSVVRAELGSLNRVVRLVKTLGMVNCTPDFTQQPAVVNGFSDLMVEVFGDQAGKGTRSAVGMASLPGGIPVEVEVIFQVRA